MASISASTGHNVTALHQTDLTSYAIPCFHAVREYLLANGVVVNSPDDSDYTFEQALDRLNVSADLRTMSPVAILNQSLSELPVITGDLQAHLEKHCDDSAVIALACAYVKSLMTVMTNELAGRAYEAGLPEAENVTEQMHGLQSASLALHYGLPLDYVVAAGLHDVARVTHPSDVYGHKHHAKEGHVLLLPLRLPSYCKDHAFAKWLLNIASPLYRDRLISPVSKTSLKMQADDPNLKFADPLKRLAALSSEDQAFMCHSLMLMRLLLDDFAKVPLNALGADLKGVVTIKQLDQLVKSQLVICFDRMAGCADPKQAFVDFCQQIKDTESLFERVAEYG